MKINWHQQIEFLVKFKFLINIFIKQKKQKYDNEKLLVSFTLENIKEKMVGKGGVCIYERLSRYLKT